MNKNIFICHRPYHILRCCDIINNDNSQNVENILFVFDVKLADKNIFQRFETHTIFYPFFDKVEELPREIPPRLRHFKDFIRFCKKTRKEYIPFVDKYNGPDKIYFFADNELEIQIMVGLFLEKSSSSMKSILVDEGLVTYSDNDHKKTKSWIRKIWLNVLFRLSGMHYFNSELIYGSSNLYNLSLANVTEKAIYFHPPVKKLLPLSDGTLDIFRNKIKNKRVPDYLAPYFLYANTYEKSLEDDLPVIKILQKILSRHNVNFYIKLHPQQNEEQYINELGESMILEKGIPIELFFSNNSIIGGTISSSLFNASLQGYEAVDISYLFNADLRTHWVQMPITEQFKWIEVSQVHTFDQFEDIINNFLKSKNFQ